MNESLCVSCKLCGIVCSFGVIEFFGSRSLDISVNVNISKALSVSFVSARVSILFDWVLGIRAIVVKCDFCSFDE